MFIGVDSKADALYVMLDESKILESEEVSPRVILDYNEKQQVVGLEMLNLSSRSPHLNLKDPQVQAA